MESVASSKTSAKAVVIGLGAGLLLMFLHGCMLFLHIEVVELDPVVLDLAKGYFGFTEEDHLQVHIADGIQFIRDSKSCASANVVSIPGNNNVDAASNGICTTFLEEGGVNTKVVIIIIDVESADSR
ncbi:uncharacterized protein LOC133821532 [Humulus lupulus]|uniref:uncharacterized protein LOC133821532 n=1 Tax=Humulus lupulus TaxID=3486 RepID=UPI002B4183B4|nr:uncharacterized protein LOC133821532 [Humulus lupulus]